MEEISTKQALKVVGWGLTNPSPLPGPLYTPFGRALGLFQPFITGDLKG
jgi:hypothetical protein